MIRNLVASAIAAIVFSIVAPGARAEEPRLPAAVAADVKSNADLCRETGSTADTKNAVKQADLTADGKPDFVLFVGWIDCPGAASLYGDREKTVRV